MLRDAIGSSNANDTVYGGQDADFVDARSGDDALRGQHGTDELYGGPGDDTLIGSLDGDRPTGDYDVSGNDLFVFSSVDSSSASASGADMVTDFESQLALSTTGTNYSEGGDDDELELR